MKGRQVLIEPLPAGGHAAALVVDGRLEDLLVDPGAGDATPRPEAIHRAVAGRPMKGLGGMFVDLGGGQRGYLRGPDLPAPGRQLTVQVSGWAEPGKAPTVGSRVRLKGHLAILTPDAPGTNLSRGLVRSPRRAELAGLVAASMRAAGPDVGLILRSAAESALAEAIEAEIAALLADWRRVADAAAQARAALLRPGPGAADLARRDWIEPGSELVEGARALADAGIWEEAAVLAAPTVALEAGTMAIEPTRALVAVDVNTAGDASPAAALKANLAAMRELPRQLRLRGLGGQVVVDPAPLAKAGRARLESALRAALRTDGIDTALLGWTPLGHLELRRKRARRPLALPAV